MFRANVAHRTWDVCDGIQCGRPGNRIWIQGEVSPGKHVGGIGEDVAHGNVVLEKSRILRPQDVGVLSSVGVAEVPVVRQPTIRIVVTGDELLPSGTMPSGFQITDANGPMLRAFCERDGGIPNHPGIVADRPASIREAMHEDVDVVLVSGVASVASAPPPHAEAKITRIVKRIKGLFFFINVTPLIYNFIQKKI